MSTSTTHSAPGTCLQIKLLTPTARAPTRGSKYAAGYDIYASEAAEVPAMGRVVVSTGIAVAVPVGTYGRIAPRSGLAVKHSLSTGAGVIDFDYRGEVKVLLFNHSSTAFPVNAGDRIAQLVLERIETPEVVVLGVGEELEGTERGVAGFGSTGGFGGMMEAVAGKVVEGVDGLVGEAKKIVDGTNGEKLTTDEA